MLNVSHLTDEQMSPGEVKVWLAVTLLVIGMTRTKSQASVLISQVCAVHEQGLFPLEWGRNLEREIDDS